ncbi:MAG: HEAT repeat domain-containing protein, partial [Planctomycetota bacterium]|nr:HEAT repeat domain-containing protein [Planctomycetota bacterium]
EAATPALLKIAMNEKAANSDRWQSIEALGNIGANKELVIPALFKLLNHKSLELRLSSIQTLHSLGAKSPRFIAIVKALLTHKEQELRYFAEDVLRILTQKKKPEARRK